MLRLLEVGETGGNLKHAGILLHDPVHRAVAQLPLARALREVPQVAPHLVLLPDSGAAVAAGQQRSRRLDRRRVLLVVGVGAASRRLELGLRRLGGLPLDLLVPRAVRRPYVKGLRNSHNLLFWSAQWANNEKGEFSQLQK